MRRLVCAVPLAAVSSLLIATGAAAQAATTPSWELKPTGVDARFRGLSAVSGKVAWASGSGGTILRTLDGGATWEDVSPPDAEELQFRDIEAFGAGRAVALSIGEGEDSRVYRTEDGGRTWTETFRNDRPEAFYNCMTFFDGRSGVATSDPVDGRFRVIATADGGRSWKVLPGTGMPPALEGEHQFAASGQCVTSTGKRDAWLATGGAAARVFHTRDRGRTWTVSTTPIPAGEPEKGVFALAFRSPGTGIAVGGDFRPDQASPDAAAYRRGPSWRVAKRPPEAYRSGVVLGPYGAAIAVGPTGSDLSRDGGRTWKKFDDGSFDTVDCVGPACWAAGEQGRVAVLRRTAQ